MVLLVRFLRALGWSIGLAVVGATLVILCSQSLPGPVEGQGLIPDDRVLGCMRASIFMAGAATIIALLMAIPVSAALSIFPPGRARRVLFCLTTLPLITMPSIFGYAWMLLATSRISYVAGFMDLTGWNHPDGDLWQSAFVQASWLWPVPALLLALAFRISARGAYQLALIDASPLKAFLRGAAPELVAPAIAASGIVFLLALLDPTIPPLLNVTQVWSVEMMAQAAAAAKFDRPVGQLFWMTWPMLVVIAAGVLVMLPGLRQIASWADAAEVAAGHSLKNRSVLWTCATLVAVALLALMPFAVFCIELWTGRQSPTAALQAARETLVRDGLASLIASAMAAIFSAALAVTVLAEPDWPRWRRMAATALFGGVLLLAVMPPEMSAAALVWLYGRGDPRVWNLYDDSPLVWAAAMCCRFGFIPVCAARVLGRRWGREGDTIARADGASRMQRLAHGRIPTFIGVLGATSVLVLLLGMSEAVISVLVQPVRLFGGSLAVQVDSQMHYGRQNETIALALLMYLPAAVGAITLSLAAGRGRIRMPDTTGENRNERR